MSRIEKALKRMGKAGSGIEATVEAVLKAPDTKSPTHVKGKIAAPTRLHHLDMVDLAQKGFLTPESKQSDLAEEFRVLKRPLLINAFSGGEARVDHANMVMVTSALQGDGKTFTTINLGLSMAMEMDTTVLLVDGDVVRPALTETLGLTEAPGLIDVLDGNMSLKDVIVRTDVPKLWVLPSGKAHGQSVELLASGRMREVAHELAKRYSDRMVLFDSPPLLATSHASVLSRLTGQVLMVVEAGKTPQYAVKEALPHISAGKIIGLALNKSPRPGKGGYYGGLYGSYGH